MRGTLFKLTPLLFLTACASNPAGVRTIMVDRPVIQVEHCIVQADVPQRPARLSDGPTPTDLETALSLALAKLSEWTRYGNRADAILQTCVE